VAVCLLWVVSKTADIVWQHDAHDCMWANWFRILKVVFHYINWLMALFNYLATCLVEDCSSSQLLSSESQNKIYFSLKWNWYWMVSIGGFFFSNSTLLFCYKLWNNVSLWRQKSALRNPFRANFKLVRVLLTHNALIIFALKPATG